MIRITAIREWSQLESYSLKWNDLVRAAAQRGQASIFQTYEWHASWWQVFGEKYELLVLLVEEDDILIGVSPWMMSREWFGPIPRKAIRFIGTPNFSSDYSNFISAPGDHRTVDASLNWLTENCLKWDRIELVHLPSHSHSRLSLESWFKLHSVGYFSEYSTDAPTRLLGKKEEDLAVLNKKSLKRHFNYFNKNGKLEFSHCESREEILAQLESLFSQHIERRALTEEVSQFKKESEREFFRVLSKNLPLEWLRFSSVRLDGELLALHFGFEFENKYFWYKPTFNVRYRKHSPGEVLLRFLLTHAIEKNLAELDFTVGNEAFKYRFANQTRTNTRFRAYRQGWEYQLMKLRKVLRDLIKGPLKSNQVSVHLFLTAFSFISE
jgi:CelD/BcsL family acetyltransferase involved in cellulose biosynthesis